MTLEEKNNMRIVIGDFGHTQAGQNVQSFTIYQENGTFCTLLSYGATLQRLMMPDRDHHFQDVVLGYDDLPSYENGKDYFGATIGRCCNRIARADLPISDRRYALFANDGRNHLHGGKRGFDKVVWRGEAAQFVEGPGVNFYYHSPDGEEGYPGNLSAQATYILTSDYRLIIRFFAASDADTVINLTNHSYFNLAGQGSGNIFSHEVQIAADFYTPTDDELIPTGQILPVAGTLLDFRRPKSIGSAFDTTDVLLAAAGGFDHNFVLRESLRDREQPVAAVFEPQSGRRMQVVSTLPGLQFYSGNMMTSTVGKEGVRYDRRDGFCLETQYFPDAVHHPGFADPIYKAGNPYQQETVYIFTAD
jgi:aldose 1-epimerase